MNPSSVVIRYDGPALAGHRMDVADLAPALLGLSELCKIANAKFNGDNAAVKVLIGADQEHQCFQFRVDVVQTLWQHAQSLIEQKDIKSAKDILEWLGLVGTTLGAPIGLFKLLKKILGKAVTEEKFYSKDGRNIVQLNIVGNDNTVITYQETYELMADAAVIGNAKKVLQPVTREGYDKVEFEVESGIVERFSKDEAAHIVDHESAPAEEAMFGEPQTITAFVRVYAPVYDSGADRWRFVYNEAHPYMDISGTTIGADAVRRGGALLDDLYKVKLEIQQVKSAEGKISAKYKITEVLEFMPATMPHQPPLLAPNDDTK